MSEENIDQKSNKRFRLLAGLGGLIVATVLGVFLYQNHSATYLPKRPRS